MTPETGDLAGFVAHSYGKAYRTACLIVRNPADAEEAVQEAFLRAWRFRDAVRPGQRLEPWLYRVLVNACYSKLRSTGRQRTETELQADLRAQGGDPADGAATAELGAVVRSALATLPEPLRVPVVLRYFAGLSEREIATVIRRRPGTVKSRLYDARQALAADPRLAALVACEEAR